MQHVIVRFAPSPTGYLHVGGARTAIFNYLFARHNGGKFLLRIEDTDVRRSTKEMTRQIISSLQWLGLDWDDEIFIQSAHKEHHKAEISRLLKEKRAYRCFCAPDELEQKRKKAEQTKGDYRYDRTCLSLSEAEIKANVERNLPYTVRLKIPAEDFSFHDGVYGKISVSAMEIDDFIIQRSDGSPVYHLAVVVDDHSMGITHVIRGNDHISNTPKQIALYRALGYAVPDFVHVPLILGADKKRLSKRHGAASVEEFRDKGILPEAMFTYLSLLGWSPGDDREVLSREELITLFTPDKLNKSDAVFDIAKLEWMNGQFIQRTDPEKLLEMLTLSTKHDFSRFSREEQMTLIELLQPRMKKLSEFDELAAYFFQKPQDFDPKGIKKHFKKNDIQDLLRELLKLWKETDFTAEKLEKSLREFAEKNNIGAGKLIHPVRLMVSGRTATPSLFDVLIWLGRDEVFDRMKNFLNNYGKLVNVEEETGGSV